MPEHDPRDPDFADLADPAPEPPTFERRLSWYRGCLERVFFGRWLLGMPPPEKEAARAKWQSYVGEGPQYDCDVFETVWGCFSSVEWSSLDMAHGPRARGAIF